MILNLWSHLGPCMYLFVKYNKSASLGSMVSSNGMLQLPQLPLLIVLDVLVLGQDPVDDNGQDADPLVLEPPKLVEDRVTQLYELTSSLALGRDCV